MRAYRSLSTWKEMAGEEFNIRDLVDAFLENDMADLAQITTDILNGELIFASLDCLVCASHFR